MELNEETHIKAAKGLNIAILKWVRSNNYLWDHKTHWAAEDELEGYYWLSMEEIEAHEIITYL